MQSKLYQNGLYMRAPPVPDAKEALQKLKNMGYWYVEHGKSAYRWNNTDLRFSLIIITARSESQREGTEEWIMEYLPDSTYIAVCQRQVVLIVPSF